MQLQTSDILIITYGSTNRVSLRYAIDAETGESVTGATVTFRLTDTAGVDVPGMSWPLTLTPDDGYPGSYSALLDAEFCATLTVGDDAYLASYALDGGPAQQLLISKAVSVVMGSGS